MLNVHPMIIYRRRQEYKEGKFFEVTSKRDSMIKDPESPKSSSDKDDEIKSLKKELAKA